MDDDKEDQVEGKRSFDIFILEYLVCLDVKLIPTTIIRICRLVDPFVRAKKRYAQSTAVAHIHHVAVGNVGAAVAAECYRSTAKIEKQTSSSRQQQQFV